ncbi:MAG: hypothetical protein WC860_06365 [Candidatus Margulisiibacteriota bacterium]|jgi:hypothetical protein
MTDHETCRWEGKSGILYKYYIWELPVNFKENQKGNYIYTKKNFEGKWQPIYIGQGDLKERSENHHKKNCISSKGATHLHVHLNLKEEDRINEEEDLLMNYTNAYSSGCNEIL